jgi:hypothetical protein
MGPTVTTVLSLETVQDNIFGMTNFLVTQKGLDVCSLISRQLNNFTRFFVLLDGTVATEILFKSLANAFHVQIVRQTRNRRNTLSTVTLLHAHVNLFFGRSSSLVSGVLKGVYNEMDRKR